MHRYGFSLRTNLRTRFTHRSGLTDPSKPIRFLAFVADPANVELVSQYTTKYYHYNMIESMKKLYIDYNMIRLGEEIIEKKKRVTEVPLLITIWIKLNHTSIDHHPTRS